MGEGLLRKCTANPLRLAVYLLSWGPLPHFYKIADIRHVYLASGEVHV